MNRREWDYVSAAENDMESYNPMPRLKNIYTINGKQWSQHDMIGWYKVR